MTYKLGHIKIESTWSRKLLHLKLNGVAPGRFGPAGVSNEKQRKGIGTVLLFDAFQALHDQGYSRGVVHWTDHLFFYAQVPGLSGIRDYWVMAKSL